MQLLKKRVVGVDVAQSVDANDSVCVLNSVERVDLDVQKLGEWAAYTQKQAKLMFAMEHKVRKHGEEVLQQCKSLSLARFDKSEESFLLMDQSKTTVEEVAVLLYSRSHFVLSNS